VGDAPLNATKDSSTIAITTVPVAKVNPRG
jgi:hypothetical protein